MPAPDHAVTGGSQSPPSASAARSRMTAAQRERQLREIAARLFAERGYDDVSIGDIANAAGVSRPIVYQHCGSKQDLYLACLAGPRAELDRRLGQLRDDDGARDLQDVVTHLLAVFATLGQSPEHGWALQADLASAPPHSDLGRRLAEQRLGTATVLAAAIRRIAPHVDPLRAGFLANALLGALTQLDQWCRHRPYVPAAVITRFARDLTVSALRDEPPEQGPDPAPGPNRRPQPQR